MPVAQQILGVVLGLVIGAALIVAMVATIMGARPRNPSPAAQAETDTGPAPIEPVHEYAGGVAEAHGPVPMIVKLIIGGVLIWTVVYVVLFAQAGFNFS